MKILLDTCGILWAVSAPEALSGPARAALENEFSEVFVSPISAAEIACAVERGRISLDTHWKKWFHQHVGINGWGVEAIDLAIIEEAYSLPGTFHADPADRILTATARLRGYTLLTADEKIRAYPHVLSLW